MNESILQKLKSAGAAAALGAASLLAPKAEAAGKAPEKTVQAESSQTYKIVKGDSFVKIAKKFGVNVFDLMKANPTVSPKRMKIGQQIVIPKNNQAKISQATKAKEVQKKTPAKVGQKMATNLSFSDAIKTNLRETIKLCENNKANPKSGWDPKLNVWKPHESVEDVNKKAGIKTIAHGHLIKDVKNLRKYNIGITDDEADVLLDQDIEIHIKNAARIYNQLSPAGKQWDDLSDEARALLTELSYNGANLRKYPKLIKAIAENNAAGIEANYKVNFQKNGVMVPDTRRNAIVYEKLVTPLLNKISTK